MYRLWTRFWYNDFTRLFVVLLGLHLIPTFFVLSYFQVGAPYAPNIIITQYMFVLCWAMVDNDYTMKVP